MPLETRTLPGRITREQNGEEVASGWCLVAFETTKRGAPLEEWRGEMACADSDARQAIAGANGAELYLHLDPYGGEFEPWHGPVSATLVDEEHDPDGRRIAIKAAGPLTRSLYFQPDTDTDEDEAAAEE